MKAHNKYSTVRKRAKTKCFQVQTTQNTTSVDGRVHNKIGICIIIISGVKQMVHVRFLVGEVVKGESE